MAYEINYNDKRFQEVEADKKQALTELEKTYGGMINESDKYYQAQIDASKQWADKQTQLQQEQTDFAIEQIEQQKDKATKDYTREQSGAYVDYQKESNRYGANAEQLASQGLLNTGYSESSQVNMFNTYQNRVATAKESYNMAILGYNNAIKDARLQNNSVLAEIAYNALQQQLEIGLQGFQYKNQLIIEQSNKKTELENTYHSRYQDVLQQINAENELAEKVRQFNEEIARLKEKDRREYELEIKQLEQQKEIAQAQLAEEQRQFDAKNAQNAKIEDDAGGNNEPSGGGNNDVVGGVIEKEDEEETEEVKYAVNTPYYQGNLNEDSNEYGVFENGYQPRGISGHGVLFPTGDIVVVNTQTLDGHKQILSQNVWETNDGIQWYWDGRENKYKELK